MTTAQGMLTFDVRHMLTANLECGWFKIKFCVCGARKRQSLPPVLKDTKVLLQIRPLL